MRTMRHRFAGDLLRCEARVRRQALQEESYTGITHSESLMPQDARTDVHTDTVYRSMSTHKQRQSTVTTTHAWF